jgi:Methyltransferase domain
MMVEKIKAAGLADKDFGEAVGGYHMQQHPEEFAMLIEALLRHAKSPQSYLGIGIAAGGAERFICEQLGIKDVTVMDLGIHPQANVWREVNKPALEAQGCHVSEYFGDTHEEAASEFLRWRGKFDIIGIDGDHTPAGVRMDWALIEPCLKPGSIVWFHDINYQFMRLCDQGPWEVWKKVRQKHKVLLECFIKFGIGAIQI